MIDQGIEMTAMWQRLRENYGYSGSYSSVRRYVGQQQPSKGKDALIRVHNEPGEELQIDFGSVGKLFDPNSGQLKTAYVFVATLCYSRHVFFILYAKFCRQILLLRDYQNVSTENNRD
jgi:transposase